MSLPLRSDPLRDQGPFHAGERAAQERLGVREAMEAHGRRVLRDFMTEQHRRFFAQLPFLVVGTVDAQGQPWSSLLARGPGFVSSPDPRHLVVRARPLPGDPLGQNLAVGADVGILGIDPSTRRRNRLNGVVQESTPEGFTVEVRQSYGNCPKYIQARTVTFAPKGPAGPITRAERLDAPLARLVGSADTFYLASAAQGPSGGADVSHRGGRPGFIVVGADRRTLTVPDYSGNFYFNTIGNLLVEPRAGLLFIDFERGDLLSLAAGAEVVWDGPEVEALPGAERLIRFTITEVIQVPGVVPLRWGPAHLSPFLEEMD
jgi:predicted pyridoxine 5'-phosphate oxidase superfamily flavin-nucleotide-binding protein